MSFSTVEGQGESTWGNGRLKRKITEFENEEVDHWLSNKLQQDASTMHWVIENYCSHRLTLGRPIRSQQFTAGRVSQHLFYITVCPRQTIKGKDYFGIHLRLVAYGNEGEVNHLQGVEVSRQLQVTWQITLLDTNNERRFDFMGYSFMKKGQFIGWGQYAFTEAVDRIAREGDGALRILCRLWIDMDGQLKKGLGQLDSPNDNARSQAKRTRGGPTFIDPELKNDPVQQKDTGKSSQCKALVVYRNPSQTADQSLPKTSCEGGVKNEQLDNQVNDLSKVGGNDPKHPTVGEGDAGQDAISAPTLTSEGYERYKVIRTFLGVESTNIERLKAVMRIVTQYHLTGQISDIDLRNYGLDLLRRVQHWRFSGLKDVVENYLMTTICIENAATLFLYGHYYEAENLTNCAKAFMIRNRQVEETEGFNKALQINPKLVENFWPKDEADAGH